jgi:hypothetical protein
MSGHGSPRPPDRATHPGRRVYEHLASAVNDPSIGGFTAIASGPRAGQQPTEVYSVGTPDSGRQHDLPLSGVQLGKYAADNSKVLGNSRRVLGGWQEGGNAHLDTPRTYPDTPVGDSAARHATLRGGEIAFGVLGNKEEGYMGDVNNPWHPKASEGDITPGNSDDARVWADMPRHTGVTSLQAKRRRSGRTS